MVYNKKQIIKTENSEKDYVIKETHKILLSPRFP